MDVAIFHERILCSNVDENCCHGDRFGRNSEVERRGKELQAEIKQTLVVRFRLSVVQNKHILSHCI